MPCLDFLIKSTQHRVIMTKKTFEQLGVTPKLLIGLKDLGYEQPSPVQAESIPIFMAGKDLVVQAQTGTGKTGAFALPILSSLSLKEHGVQALILAPTRELAIQVAESFQSYAKHMPGFQVLPIYGGQSYDIQLRGLKRGPHVVVGTPGRVMDHLRRGTLTLDRLKTLVLDEADEMLRMGFIDDVEWILEQIPGDTRQTALFSATMPESIRKVANKYLRNPVKVHIESNSETVDTIAQHYVLVSPKHKLEALTRFLEMQEYDATIIFTRTKTMSSELADKLAARGYSAAAINGDLSQAQREKVITRIKNGSLDIVVATEVAARGLDVDRLSFVVNYDIPYDAESYTHRIGRTGRAGRKGVSLTLVCPREVRILRDIERGTRQTINEVDSPSLSDIQKKRMESFCDKINDELSTQDLEGQRHLIQKMAHTGDHSELDIAAALAFMVQGDTDVKESGPNHLPVVAEEASSAPRRRRSPPGSSGRGRNDRGGDRHSDRGGRSGDRGAPPRNGDREGSSHAKRKPRPGAKSGAKGKPKPKK